MKYNIFINQKQLAKTNLDLADATILDYLYFLCGSVSPKIEKERVDGYTWADYGKIIEDNPLLRIKSRGAITQRIKKLKEAGFIETLERRKNGHKFVYVRMTYLIDSLFTEMNRGQEPIHSGEKPIHEKEKPIHETAPIKTTTYNTTNDKDKATKLQVVSLIDSFKVINPVYKSWFGNKTQRKACSDLLDLIDLDKLLKLVQSVLPVTNTRQYAPSITTPHQLLQKFAQLQSYLEKEKSNNKKNIIL